MLQINYMWMVLNKQQRWYLCLYTFRPVYYTCIHATIYNATIQLHSNLAAPAKW